MSIHEKIASIQRQIQDLPIEVSEWNQESSSAHRISPIKNLIDQAASQLSELERPRVLAEFDGWGPLESLMQDESISEILVNSPQDIWFEREGYLHRHNDNFSTPLTFQHFIDRLSQHCLSPLTMEQPFSNGKYQDFRIHLVSSEMTKKYPTVSLRRHPKSTWTLDKLQALGWATLPQIEIIKTLIKNRENLLVIGTTGSGKTSLLNACLQQLAVSERAVLIEDTPELTVPNSASVNLCARPEGYGSLAPISQEQLVRQALRMRPDRVIVGEVRGPEAKDLLLALSTGHAGSWGTLHAQSPQQALLRLEMLVQLGAPQWALQTVRTLIFLSLRYLIVVGKSPEGRRGLQGIYQISSREESGLLLELIG